jgi:hypothetical protein
MKQASGYSFDRVAPYMDPVADEKLAAEDKKEDEPLEYLSG